MPHEIMLITGETVDIFDAEAGHKLTPKVIAAGLARECRFARQTHRFYSVAAHTLLCAGLADNIQDAAACLLHDSAEAVFGDIARPIKKAMAEYRDLEQMLLYRIFAAYRSETFPLELPLSPMIKRIDDYALALEASWLMPQFATSEFWAPQRELIARWGEYDLVRHFQWGDTPHRVEGDDLYGESSQFVLEGMLRHVRNGSAAGLSVWRALAGTYIMSNIANVREQLRERGFYNVG